MARKPLPPGPGRPKGSKNRVNLAFRDAIVEAFEELGGVQTLVKWGKKNPTEFYKIAARLIPIEQQHSGALSLTVVTGVPQPESSVIPTT